LKTAHERSLKEDIWIKSTCSLCFSNCAIRVHRVNGVVVKIEGNPDCPTSGGGICPKGASGLMLLYDPNRVNVPLKRTNPEKGIGVDPKWVEISWEEALNTITDKLKIIKATDSRKLMNISSVLVMDYGRMASAFSAAFGSTDRFASGAGVHCGNGAHLFSGMMQSAWVRMPDTNFINYYLNFGCPSGFGAYYVATGMARRMAAARRRGMKHVSIEPWMGMPGINSDEWIPIRPGTDAALALAMVNLLLNEYEIFDAKSIQQYTNGPYLVSADGYYLREKRSGKPLIWDRADRKAKTYDDLVLKDAAIEGIYLVNGCKARPAFSLLKEHVKKYSPEMASEITTVPVEIIRRLSLEFGEAARIGSNIIVDGKELPYRPVAVGYFRGAHAHKHSALINMTLNILQEIVGANNVPGGSLGINSRSFGYPGTDALSFSPVEGPDGLLSPGLWGHDPPWPLHPARKPETVKMQEMVPTAGDSPLAPIGILENEKYKLPYKTGFILHTGGNYIMNIADPLIFEKAFKESIFTVSFSLFLDESTEFSDIVLPDTCYLERLDIQADWQNSLSPLDEWVYHLRQPVVNPMFQRRQTQIVLLELADRLGILGEVIKTMNKTYGFTEPYTLDVTKRYIWEDMVDFNLKGRFGSEHGLDWFKINGLIHWPKKAEEVYWRPFVKGRIPIYFEHFLTVGKQVERIKKDEGIPDFDTADFQPLPDWKPCASYMESRSEYDLYGIYYRMPFHTSTSTANNPWLDEVSKLDPYTDNVIINSDSAKKRGIKNGDKVIIESAGTGGKIAGKATLTEAIHPEVIAYSGNGGHWAKSLPVANKVGKGVCPEWLIPLSFDQIDVVSLNLDLCVKVKVTKIP
jgi:anaerobic selenocysteine-containing dehydrogenase